MVGWDPLKESLCEYVHRLRIEEQMSADHYDDFRERKLAQAQALGIYWARESPEDPQLDLIPLGR